MLVSVLAALLAISSLAGSRASTEAILAQAKASDAFNEYQANSLKRHINLDDAAQLRILAANTPAAAEANKQADSLEQAVKDKYQPSQDELLPKAQELEHERDLAEARHRGFQTAEAAFQLGIVLSSISIVARTRWLLYSARQRRAYAYGIPDPLLSLVYRKGSRSCSNALLPWELCSFC